MKTASDLEIYLLELINAERKAHGLKALVLERNLNDSAERYSERLLEAGHFSHTGPDGSSVRERIAASTFDMSGSWSIGENLAAGMLAGGDLRGDVESLHQALMDSPGHRANILRDGYTHVGIGIEIGDYDPFSGRPTMMITQNFGASSGRLDTQVTGSSGNDRLSGGTGDDLLTGDAGDDRLSGGAGKDSLYGGAGKDSLNGGAGNDRLRGGYDDDRLYGKDGRDTLLGDSGDDYLSGADGDDRLYGDRGRDLLNGGAGDDRLRGGYDDDRLYGKDGRDTLLGDSGDDYLSGADGDDRLYGGHGRDTLNGGQGDDRLLGGGGGDWLYGKEGDDTLLGEGGRDRLSGADGRDVLDGGAGDDWLTGGGGADTFVFAGRFGDDRIRDLQGDDRIDLGGVASIAGYDDLVRNHLEDTDRGAVIDDGAGNTITLDGIHLADLGADHFLF